jgi:hypothetical protein
LQHNWHVGCVEELDGVGATKTTRTVRLDRDLNAEALEIDDDGEYSCGRDEIHDVGQTLAPECFAKGTALVIPGEEEVEERDDGAFKLGTTASVDGGRRECLPDDRLADVGGDKERDTGAETVTFLKKLVEENDDQCGDDELDDEEKADTSANVTRLSIETGEHHHRSLAE